MPPTYVYREDFKIGDPLIADEWNVILKTVTKTDLRICDATAGPMTISLPEISTYLGYIIVVKKIDNVNNVTVSPFSPETIDGQPLRVLTVQNECVTLFPHGTTWYII